MSDVTFTDDESAKHAIEDLLHHFGMPDHVAWFDIRKLAITSLVNAVETQGVNDINASTDRAVQAAVYLSHGKAKP